MKRPIVTMLAAGCLFATGAGAADFDPEMPIAQTQGSVRFISGGVGEGQRERLDRLTGYNLHLEFAVQPRGQYLADVEVTIADRSGGRILQTTSSGPWLLAELPAGQYRVSARFADTVRSSEVSVPASGTRRVVMRFPESAMASGFESEGPGPGMRGLEPEEVRRLGIEAARRHTVEQPTAEMGRTGRYGR